MITNNLTIDQLDRFLSISAFVDNKLPKVSNKRTPSMFKLIDDLYGIGETKETIQNSSYSYKGKMKIVLTSRQITIYDFVATLMLDATKEDRELIYLRNFPHRKSYRELKKMYLDVSHEKLRYMYFKALKSVCKYANKDLKKYI
tara:strand:+ start:13154 stop:13585 length:432 start_codon:yes stop_codon:yes gene_type:complete